MQDFDPRYKTRQAQGDHGVDLDRLRTQLDKLHSIPQLAAGINGKLSRMTPPKPEPRELTDVEASEEAVKALAQCVATAEGEFIDKAIRAIFRDDGIGMSYNRRVRMMREGNAKPMADMLKEMEIEINHQHPPEGYEMPEDVIFYRRLEIKKSGKVRADRVWEWKEGE